MTEQTYTEAQATDEALRALLHRLRWTNNEALHAAWAKVPDQMKNVLSAAEARALVLREADQQAGITRQIQDRVEDDDLVGA